MFSDPPTHLATSIIGEFLSKLDPQTFAKLEDTANFVVVNK